MSSDNLDMGPLAGLIGVWTGDHGTDVAPEQDGDEPSDYSETITFSAVTDVENAEEQELVAVHYHQVVTRKRDGKVYHNQTGYWMYEPETGRVMHAFTIPRAVGVLAGGVYKGETDGEGRAVINVAASLGDADWGIIQSPFMAEKASTKSFQMIMSVGDNTLTYNQTTMVEIYGRTSEHTDTNTLKKT